MVGIVSKLPEVDIKTMRLVSKTWNEAVVQSMDPSKVDLSVASKMDRKYLITTIKLPLSRLDYNRIMEMSLDGKFRLVGAGLRLTLRENPNDAFDNIEGRDDNDRDANAQAANEMLKTAANALRQVLASVRHLEIFYEGVEDLEHSDIGMEWDLDYSNLNGGSAAMFGPLLQKMNRVVRIRLTRRIDAEILRHLPRMQQIEELIVLDEHLTNDDACSDWNHLLRACQSQLKLLHAPMFDPELWTQVHFPKLMEVRLRFNMLARNEYDCFISRAAPNIRILKTPCGMQDWVFLIELTHRLKFLEYLAIELTPNHNAHVRLPKVPLTYAKFASARLMEVYISTGQEWRDEWNAEIEQARRLVSHLFVPATKVTLEQCVHESEEQEEEEQDEEGNVMEFKRYVKKIWQLQGTTYLNLPHANKENMEKFFKKMIELVVDNESRLSLRGMRVIEQLLHDLLQVARCVNGPVMVSKELWSYLGGHVPYQEFFCWAKMTEYVVSKPLTVSASMVIFFLHALCKMLAIENIYRMF